jgi:hypothetical protein
MAAKLFASATGPRTTGKATVVAKTIRSVPVSTAANAVGPSSHGRGKTRWSLTERAWKPTLSAISAYSRRRWRVQGWLSRAISGRCAP